MAVEHCAPLPALEHILCLVNPSNKDADQNLNNLTAGSPTNLLRSQGSALTQGQFWVRLFHSFFVRITDSTVGMGSALDVLTSTVFVACSDQESQVSTLFLKALCECLLSPIDKFLGGHGRVTCDDNAEKAALLRCVLVKVEITLDFFTNEVHRSMDRGTDATEDLWQVALFLVNIYDRHILPLHTSGLDDSPLISGVLSVLQLLKRASLFQSSVDISRELMSRICLSDLPFRAVKLLQGNVNCETQRAACVAFIVSIVDFQKLFSFVNSKTCLQGDSLPDFASLLDLELHDLLGCLKPYRTAADSRRQQETYRWAVAFCYIQEIAGHDKSSRDRSDMFSTISTLIAGDSVLDSFCGSSWIQLSWLYIKLGGDAHGNDVVSRPFTYSRIVRGLRMSIKSSTGILERHLEDILVWLWAQDTQDSMDVAPVEIHLTLLTRWIWNQDIDTTDVLNPMLNMTSALDHLADFAGASQSALRAMKFLFSDSCRAFGSYSTAWNEHSLEVLVKVCNFVASIARRMDFQQQPLRDYQTLFLEGVIKETVQVLTRDFVDVQVLLLLWELLDSMDPYLLDQDKLKTESFWELTEIDTAPILSALLKKIEAVQTGCDEDPLVYVRMSCWERILLVLSKLSEDDFFEDDPLALSALWEAIQVILDDNPDHLNLSGQIEMAASGMLLLIYMHDQFSRDRFLSVDDIVLMAHYCIQLQRKDETEKICRTRPNSTYMLVIDLTRTILARLQSAATQSADDSCLELCLDLLLDVQREYLIKEVNTSCIWYALHELCGLLQRISPQPTLQSVCEDRALNRVQAFLVHPGQEEMINSLLARWLEECPVMNPEKRRTAHQSPSAQKVLYHVATDILSIVYKTISGDFTRASCFRYSWVIRLVDGQLYCSLTKLACGLPIPISIPYLRQFETLREMEGVDQSGIGPVILLSRSIRQVAEERKHFEKGLVVETMVQQPLGA